MELYYKDLISEDGTLEKLVDDLMLVVQGANEFVDAAGARLPKAQREEIRTRLERLKDRCIRVRKQAVASALAADKVLHEYPYSAIGFAFAIGLFVGAIKRKRSS